MLTYKLDPILSIFTSNKIEKMPILEPAIISLLTYQLTKK